VGSIYTIHIGDIDVDALSGTASLTFRNVEYLTTAKLTTNFLRKLTTPFFDKKEVNH